MIRNTLRPRTSLNVVKCVRRSLSTETRTPDWEGVHGWTGDTKLPFTGWQPQPENGTQNPSNIQQSATPNVEVKKPSTHIRQGKTVAEKDAEMRAKLEGISGEGGEAGVELEDGKAVGLKRGVKENMFRII
ncbi:uncharacterized protein PAC_07552 [Phialocephala subalpina]|uniref:Uncharacterized protein n=1 Tax=Phialocephala subalpina TaxID=576137 RepID=A0A1L7WY17_9HELO|nr:uncharacterized protein PAC_07552 [Phialocephala subalpina]